MNTWRAHMLTGIEKMTMKMRAGGTCRTDVGGPACRRGETRGAWRVARFAVVAVMAMVFGLAGFVASAQAVTVTDNTPTSSSSTGSAWTNPNNALAQDGASAEWKNTDQSYLVLTGFDFSAIPAGAQIPAGCGIAEPHRHRAGVSPARVVSSKLRLRLRTARLCYSRFSNLDRSGT